MEEDEVNLFDDFVTEDSIYLIEDVEKENRSLLDARIIFEKVQCTTAEPKDIKENNNEESKIDCQVKTTVKENEATDTDVNDDYEDSSMSENNKKIQRHSKSKVNNYELKRSTRSEKKVVPIVDDSSKEESDFSADEDSSYTPEDEKVEGNKYNRRYKSGSVRNDSDDSDPGDESENSSCKIKEEGRDSEFYEEDDKKSLHNEDDEKDEDEAIFETKIEVEYHGVKYDDEDESWDADDFIKKENLENTKKGKREISNGGHLQIKQAAQKKEYKCQLCDEKFPTRQSKVKHVKTKHDGYRCKCPHCPKTYKRSLTLKMHVQSKHGDPSQRINHKCPHCLKAYSRRGPLNEHIKSRHGDSTERKKYTCPHCDKILVSETSKMNHIRIIHGGFKSDRLKQHVEKQRGDPKEYECTQCGDKFGEKDSLTRHVKVKHECCKYTCPHCPKAYMKKIYFMQHVESQHGDPLQRKKYNCPQCDKTFASLESLKTHIKKAHEGFKLCCPHCSKVYTNKLSLDKHLQSIHAVNREYKCPLCDEILPTIQSRSEHIKTKHKGHCYK